MKKVKLNLIQLGEEYCKKNNLNTLSMRQLSLKTGIRPDTIKLYVSNTHKIMPMVNINKLLNFFNCNIEELFVEVEDGD